MGDFYGTGIEIWTGFGPIGSTEKKGSGPIMSNFWGCFFHVFSGKKKMYFFFKKHCIVLTKNLHKMKLEKKILKNLKKKTKKHFLFLYFIG